MNERDWINGLLDRLDACGGPGTPTRAQARLILSSAEAEGYQPVEVPSQTGVAIGWPSTDNQSHTGTLPPTFE